MDDRYDPNLILGYVEGEVTADDRARVEAMLADDPALGSLVADLQRDRSALRDAPPIEPPHDLADAAIAAIERQMLFADHAPPTTGPAVTASRRFGLAPLLTYGGIAAVLAITVTVVFQSLLSDPSPTATVALSEAPEPGLSLAEATLEAQRKAAAGGGDRGAGVAADSAEVVAQDTADLVAESLAKADLDGMTPSEASRLLAEIPQAADAVGPLRTDALALSEPASEPRRSFSRADGPAAAAAPARRNEAFADAGGRLEEQDAAIPAAVAAPSDALADATLAAEAMAWDEAATGSTATLRSRATDVPAAPAVSAPDPMTDDLLLAAIETEVEWGRRPAVREPEALAVGYQNAKSGDAALPSASLPTQRYTLNLITPTPDRSRQQLRDWALQNNVAVAAELPAGGEGAESNAASRLAVDAVARQSSPAPPRLTLTIPAAQISDLVTALSEPNWLSRPQALPLQPWMNWQAPLQRAEVQVVIEPSPP